MCLFLVYPNACFYISTTDTLCQSANVLLLLYSKHYFPKNLSATSVIVGEYPRTTKCNNYNKYYFAHQLQTLSSVSILASFYRHDLHSRAALYHVFGKSIRTVLVTENEYSTSLSGPVHVVFFTHSFFVKSVDITIFINYHRDSY